MSEKEIFDAYLRGDLPEDRVQELEQQLATDSELADRFEAHSRPSEELKAVQPVETPDLRHKVKKRIRRRSGGKFFAGSGLKAILGSASLIALLVGLVLFLLMGPFGLLGDEQLHTNPQTPGASDETEAPAGETPPRQQTAQGTSEDDNVTGAEQAVADEAQTADEFERALDEVRRGGGLATPGRVSGSGAGSTGTMYVVAYTTTFDKPRDEVGRELRLLLPDDDVVETDEGFEFSIDKAEVAQMLTRLSEFGASIEDFRREAPHTERNVAFFRVVLQ